MSENDNKTYEPAIHLSLQEVERQAAKHRGNPIIQQLLFLMREREETRAEQAELVEALVESLALNENYEAVEEKNGYEFTEAPEVIRMGRAAIAKATAAESGAA